MTGEAELEAVEASAAERVRALGDGTSAERLEALLALGRVRRAQGGDAGEPLRQALAAAERLRDRAAWRDASVELGAWLISRGDHVLARAHLERALEAATRARDARAKADAALAAAALAHARATAGDHEGARAALDLARVSSEEAPLVAARAAACAAEVHRLAGRANEALAELERAELVLASVTGDARRVLAVEVARARARLDAAPGAAELRALGAEGSAALLEGVLAVAGAEPARRAAVALDVALRLTGAVAGEVRADDRVLAATADADASLPAEPVARSGARSLRLAGARAPGARLIGRALLAALGPASATAAARANPPERIFAMLDRVLEVGLDLDRVVAVATDLAVEATGAARGLILLREPGARLGFTSARRGGVDIADPAGVVSRSLVREAFLSGRAILLADAASDPRHAKVESLGGRGVRSVLVAPIGAGQEATGVLYLDDPGTIGRFGAVERDVAIGFAARLGPTLAAVLDRERERASVARMRASVGATRPATKHPYDEIVGHGKAIGEVLQLLDRAVESRAPVLVHGESGTGKELIARALHRYGPRARGPFEALSCAALAESVLESELFGHVAGSFTGAKGEHKGAFERAHGGTLFLDELQEASPKLQAELLRALETGEVRPVGAAKLRRVDVRLVAATNADLAALVAAGSFREDLYYRVRVLPIALPPLRERLEDVPELVAALLARSGSRRELAPGVLEKLAASPWPGNVRALKNCLERAVALAGDGPIRPEHVQPEPALPRAVRRAGEPVYAGSIELNERQLALIERLRASNEGVRNADHARDAGVSQPTGWRDLVDLVAKGVLVATGGGRRTTYRLAPGWEARLRGE